MREKRERERAVEKARDAVEKARDAVVRTRQEKKVLVAGLVVVLAAADWYWLVLAGTGSC